MTTKFFLGLIFVALLLVVNQLYRIRLAIEAHQKP